jgi:hypothetical protein
MEDLVTPIRQVRNHPNFNWIHVERGYMEGLREDETTMLEWI